MNIIIIGCGKVGLTLTKQLLDEGHAITVIDTDPDVIESITTSLDVMGVVGNGASYLIQQEAGIESADLMIAVTESDELNLLCCLIAKKAGDCHTIARVRNPVYNKEISFLKESLGLTMIVNPDSAAATEISRILRRRSVLDINPFAKGRVEMLKIRIDENSPLIGLPLYELPKKLRCEVLICVVERGSQISIPDGNFVLAEGDLISFLATPQNASAFLKKAGLRSNGVRDCMIVGGSKGAYYLADQLINHGIAVKIIEKNRQRCEELGILLPKAVIINGDGTDQSLLLEEGLEYIDSFVTMTDVDEENIVLSLFAHTKSSAKIVTKVNRLNFDGVIDSLDIGTTIYPKNTTAEYVIRYVRARQNSLGSNVETLYRIIENKVEALEFIIREPSGVTDTPLEELGKNRRLRDHILIGCIIRQGKSIIPRGSDKILVGDTVVLVSGVPGLTDIKDILRK